MATNVICPHFGVVSALRHRQNGLVSSQVSTLVERLPLNTVVVNGLSQERLNHSKRQGIIRDRQPYYKLLFRFLAQETTADCPLAHHQ